MSCFAGVFFRTSPFWDHRRGASPFFLSNTLQTQEENMSSSKTPVTPQSNNSTSAKRLRKCGQAVTAWVLRSSIIISFIAGILISQLFSFMLTHNYHFFEKKVAQKTDAPPSQQSILNYASASRLALGGEPPRATYASAPIELTRVIDGDTIEAIVCNACRIKFRLRLIGINTPERGKPGFKAATVALRNLLENKNLRIEFEDTTCVKIGEHKKAYDSYRRLLVYLYAHDPTTNLEIFINAEMIRLGHSKHYTKYGTGRNADILQAQDNLKYKLPLSTRRR